jgi:hypothetical protein
MVTMTYANGLLNTKIAQNEFNANKQFMHAAGQQIDDIAWTIGRTQTVSYSSRYGTIKLQESAVDYTFKVHYTSTNTWETLTVPGETGMILFNIPVDTYSMGKNYFERVPMGANSSFLLLGSSAPVTQVLCEEKIPMTDGSFTRIALVPTVRVLTSTITSSQNTNTSYLKFYLPVLESGKNLYLSQSITMTGDGISKITRSGVDQVTVSVSFPEAASLGFDSSFFNFKSNTITLNSPANSVVEFYIGKVQVTIGQV